MGNEATPISVKILEAAEERFRHYGYRKTTMAEIAKDSHMSAANLYRYYTNKEDIGAACVLRCFQEAESSLRAIVNAKHKSASKKLHEFVIAKFEHVHNEVNNNPNINELIEMFVTEKAELLLARQQAIQSMIAEILAEGNRTGEFEVDDIIVTAESISNAIVGFHFPMFMPLFAKEKFIEMAHRVVDLLIRGLLPKTKH